MEIRPLRVAIIDQERVFVDALCFRLSTEADLQVVCALEDIDSGWVNLQETRPDIVILAAEHSMGGALDLTANIRRNLPETKVLFLIRTATDALLDQALRLHVEGLLSRSESLTTFVQAVRRVAAGERPISSGIEARLDLDPMAGEYRLRADPRSKTLTDRQLEILRHLARGDSVKAVARKLFLSPKSVDNQKFRIMNKIGVRDKVSLALFAVREGLIQP